MRSSSARVKICLIPHVNLNRQVNSASNFAPFFIVMTHNSAVNFKLIHFLFWIKGSHQNPNFVTFECSGENLPSFSCHFPNHKSAFLQILHDSSLSWKITPLYFFRSNVIYFALKGSFKVQIFETWVLGSEFYQILVIFETTNRFYIVWNFMYFQQKESIKVQIWWNFMWAVESLNFCTLMGSFC